MKYFELTEQRERLGLTRAELAEKLRVGYQTVHRWETERRSIPDWAEAFLERLMKEGKKK